MLLAVCLFPVSNKNKKYERVYMALDLCWKCESVKSVMLHTCIYDVEMSGNDI